MTPETVRYHGDPQVILAYLKYQWSIGDDHKRKDALCRLKVHIVYVEHRTCSVSDEMFR